MLELVTEANRRNGIEPQRGKIIPVLALLGSEILLKSRVAVNGLASRAKLIAGGTDETEINVRIADVDEA